MEIVPMDIQRVALYLPIAEPDNPVRKCGYVFLMGNHHHGGPFLVQLAEQLHDLNGGSRIQVACGQCSVSTT